MIECKICSKEFENEMSLVSHLTHPKSLCKTNIKSYYDKFIRKDGEGVCVICKKETGFLGLKKGYPFFYCGKCSNKSEDKNSKRSKSLKKTLNEKSDLVKLKLRLIDILRKLTIDNKKKLQCQICGKTFESYSSISKHLKVHKISLKDYYNEYFKTTFEDLCLVCMSKTKFTSLEKGYCDYCSSTCVSRSEVTRESFRNTSLSHYGQDHPTKDKEVNFKQIDGIRRSIKNRNTEIVNKRKNTCLIRYNKECISQVDEIKEKYTISLLKYYKSDKYKKRIEVNLKRFFDEVYIPRLKVYLQSKDIELIEEYYGARKQYKFKCLKCSTNFIRLWNGIPGDSNINTICCPTCFPKNRSQAEREIYSLIRTIFNESDIIVNDRSIIKPLELDIVIESCKTAIEYCGLYTHSEVNKLKDYHLYKLNKCIEKGYKLITIFEDEWIFKKEIVIHRLKNILNKNLDKKRIGARECIIKEISYKEKSYFLNSFHLQGNDISNINLGAFYKNELISIMTFSKGNISKGSKAINSTWELSRFCSNYNFNIPGIASKLLSFFKKNYEWIEIFSYADKRWSEGNLYKILGFNLEYETSPNYWYFKDYKRIHRFTLRKKPDEDKNTSEWKLRLEEGYLRIWDCGSLKFSLKNTK